MQKLVISQVSVEGRVLNADEHGLPDGPVMAVDFLVYYIEMFLVHGMSCGGAVMGKGALKCFLTLSPKDLPDSPMYALGQFIWGHL